MGSEGGWAVSDTPERPTPETDAKKFYSDIGGWVAPAVFAATLERQRDEAREQARYGWERHAEKDAAYGKALAQRDRLLEALEKAVAAHAFDAAWKPAARAVIAEVKGTE